MSSGRRHVVAVPPPPPAHSRGKDPSPRPVIGATLDMGGSATSSIGGATAFKTPSHLLQQMEMMMKTWDAAGAGTGGGDRHHPPTEGGGVEEDDELQQKLFKLEATRSILALFTSGSGVYSPILSKVFMYLFDLIETLLQEVDEKKVATQQQLAEEAQVSSAYLVESPLTIDGPKPFSPTALGIAETKRVDYAFGKVRKTQDEMHQLVLEANEAKVAMQQQINGLVAEKKKLQELIEFQADRARQQRIDVGTSAADREKKIHRLVTTLTLESQIHDLEGELVNSQTKNVELRKKLKAAETLNGRYAMQAVQLAARVKVFHEHNERFATLLSMQYDERAATERENDLLRSELLDLNKFHQLRRNVEGEAGTVTATSERRAIRHGLGNNSLIPRHLHYCGLMNRFVIAKDAAVSLVTDLLVARGSQGKRTDFQTFLHNFLTKKHQADAVAWAYSLDEACELNDADPALNIFKLVSRQTLREELYDVVHTDITIFLEACEAVDQMQHGELQLTVPVAHVLGILLEMFPSYPDGAFRKAMEQLQLTLTTNAHTHYHLLFPNLEREEAVDMDAFSRVDLRTENQFSTTFKELIVDDAVVSMQFLEDAILHLPNDRVTLADVTTAVGTVFEDPDVAEEVAKELRFIVKQEMKSHKYEMSLPKYLVVHGLRAHTIIRRGIFRSSTTTVAKASTREQMATNAISEWTNVTGEELVKVDYRELVQRTKARRAVFEGEESDESDIEFEAEA